MTSATGAAPAGRRERKKAATRAAISAAALRLFLDRGFESVSIREIAQEADVAVATVFAHFDSKEALVFDEDAEIAGSLVAAVVDRATGVDPLAALEEWFSRTRAADDARRADADFAAFRRLVEGTPLLRQHWQQTWRQHKAALAEALETTAATEARVAALTATLVVEGYLLAADDDRSDAALALLFRVLRHGLPQATSTGTTSPPARPEPADLRPRDGGSPA